MFRVEYAAGISASARDRRPNPTLRRGLCQQTSRIALLSVIGLAAAGGGSLLTPEEALADCKVGVDVQCQVSTDTTNTKYAGGIAVYRFYEGATGVPFTGSVAAGVTISGHGLAFGNIAAGGVNFVNEGVIGVDVGNVPTEGGAAALNLTAAGGALTYSGGGDIINAGAGDGLVAFQTGVGSIDLNISGDVSAAAGAGVFARHAGDGTTTVNVTGKVTGTDDSGILLISNRGVALTVADTVTGATGLTVTGGLSGSGDISVTGAGAFVGVNGDGVIIDNLGSGDVVVDLSGPISATGGNGVFVRNSSVSGDINVTTGDVSVTGPAFTVLDIVSASETGNVTVTANGVLSGGRQGVSAGIDTALGTGNVGITTAASVDSERGIHGFNLGSGSVTVTAAGPIAASVGTGITARSAGGAITVTAGDITGVGGIDARQDDLGFGGEAITINATGAITSAIESGIVAVGNDSVHVTVADTVSGASGLVIFGGTLGAGSISVTGAGGFVGQNGDAVFIENRGSGSVLFDVAGPIVATGGSGVVVTDTAAGGDISITTGDVTADGANRGILAVSQSTTADVTITVDGDLNAGGVGVQASILDAASIGEIRVTTNGAVNAATGIDSVNRGSGGIEVTATGPIVASAGQGIRAETTGGGAITLTAGDVTSTAAGLFARQAGAGPAAGIVTVNATGTVNSTGGTGIVALGDAAVNVTVARTVTGATEGLSLRGGRLGAGDISVTGAGGFVGLNGDAVDIENLGSGSVLFDVSGPIVATGGSGVRHRNTPIGGDVTITTGDVTVTDPAFVGLDIGSASQTGDVTVTVNGALTGGAAGVLAFLDSGTATGDISITTRGSIDSRFGIFGANLGSGSVTVVADGPIVASEDEGILATTVDGAVRVIADDITAAASGIVARQDNSGAGGAAVTVNVNGTINSAAGIGIAAIGNDAVNVTVARTVTGTGGLLLLGGARGAGDISVTGAGGFVGLNGHGAFVENLGSGSVLFDVSGPIVATGGSGVLVRDTVAGGGVSVTTGDVTATDPTFINLNISSLSQTGDVTVTANGALTGGIAGVQAFLESATATGDVAVTTRASIDSRLGILGFNAGSGSVTVNAAGPISASTSQGIGAVTNGGAITVTAGDITAHDEGLFARQDSPGVGGGAITINATGAIVSATRSGISAFGENAVNVTVARTVTGESGLQIEGGGSGAGDISVTGAGGFVGQNSFGAFINNLGSGSVLFDVSGPIVATGGEGVFVRDTVTGGNISVTTGDVTANGLRRAIEAVSQSITADVTVTTNGNLQAGEIGVLAGINHQAATGDLRVTTNGSIDARTGIVAQNFGSGSVTVTAAGPIRPTTGTGIFALGGTGDITVSADDVISTGNEGVNVFRLGSAIDTDAAMNVSVGDVEGTRGIQILNGRGAIAIAANGAVRGTVREGLRATGGGAVNATIRGSVTGATSGLFVFGGSSGSGDVSVTGAGSIVGQDGHGAFIRNLGSGSTTVNLSGVVRATGGVGLFVQGGGAVDLTAFDVSGETGIDVNAAAGRIAVTTNGAVVGTLGAGIAVAGAGTDIDIDAFNVTGATVGISTNQFGIGETGIHVRGVVEGGTSAIQAFSPANQTVRILNDGVVRNSSGASDAQAILASGGVVRLTNAGTLVGDVILDADATRFLNAGSWNNIGGDSVFFGANDALENAAGGRILGASGAGVLDRTLWRGLERFGSSGLIDLSDGAGGDAVITSADTVFQNGSVLKVDVGGANGSDAFATSGTLDIQAGSRLVVNFVEPLALNFRYVVAQADGGLTGRFEMEDQLLTAFLGLRDGYTDTTAFIEIAQLRALAAAGVTPNQKATAAGADSLADDNILRSALLRLPDDAAAIDAFDQLSGEIHPVARRAMADDSRLPRTAVLDRLADDGRTGSVWGRGFVEERITDADLNAAKAERDTGGVLFGVDRRLGDSLTVGVAAGRFNTDLNVNDRHSRGRIRTAQGLAYVGGRVGRWGLRAGVGYAETSTHTEREIAFPGISASPEARYDGSVLQGFVDAGYRIALQSGYLEPFASLTNIRAETDAFTETSGSAALSGEANTDELTISTLGLRFGTRQVGAFSLRGSAGWQDMSGDLNPDARHAFDGGSTFTVLGAAQSDRAAVVDLGAQWRLSPNMTMGVAYDGVLGTEGQDHAVSGSFRVAF